MYLFVRCLPPTSGFSWLVVSAECIYSRCFVYCSCKFTIFDWFDDTSNTDRSFTFRTKPSCPGKIVSTLEFHLVGGGLSSFRNTLRWNLIDLTAASHKPPSCGAAGGLNAHVIPNSEHCC
ncbi:unnamed protein product [Orchesella dallaii]|uniref:Secreted protein n=1 Tax=Orchesella dallaii TaxID=48710 RepID=A0ABP1Q588_9HEXA